MSRLFFLLLISLPSGALAEKADREKPTQVEANRMSADDVKRVNVFEGNVVVTRGTIRVLADRLDATSSELRHAKQELHAEEIPTEDITTEIEIFPGIGPDDNVGPFGRR